MQTITGTIVSVKKFKNNTYQYFIKDENKNTEKYIYFASADNDNPGLDASRVITIKYIVKENGNYPRSNIIKEFVYGNFVSNDKAIAEFLINGVGLTHNLAAKLLTLFKDKTLQIIFHDTDKMHQIEDRHIESAIAKVTKYKEMHANIDFCIELTDLGINVKYHKQIINLLGCNIDSIKKAIYNLYFVIKVPFVKVDTIALTKLDYAKDHPKRILAFIDDLYKRLNKMGILYECYNIIEQACHKVNVPVDKVIPNLIKIKRKTGCYYTCIKNDDREQFIERLCTSLASTPPVTQLDYDITKPSNSKINMRQSIAIKNALDYSISIVTGGPGTGKSFIIGSIIEKLSYGNCIHVLAPTGAAVERLRSEPIIKKHDVYTRTLQSFIFTNTKPNPHEAKPVHGSDFYDKTAQKHSLTINELYNVCDEFIFFIDEFSMVDMKLFCSFLDIISKVIDKVRIVLLGDVNQLASIQGGNLLNDLIRSGVIPYTVLEKNYRSNEEIKLNSQLALDGGDLQFNNDVSFIEVDSDAEIKTKLVNLIKTNKIAYENSCVLIPVRKGAIGINAFNPVLQKLYNNANMENKTDTGFYINDKIIQCKNNKEKSVYNGSILVVDDIDCKDDEQGFVKLKCRYYENECDINSANKNYDMVTYKNKIEIEDNELDLAYAMTIHKAQGKGYDSVIIIIHSNMYSPVLNRNMLYTAITRAKNKCIIIGNHEGLLECKKKMIPRITNLYQGRINRACLIDEMLLIDSYLSRTNISEVITYLMKEYNIDSQTKLVNIAMKHPYFYDQLMFYAKKLCTPKQLSGAPIPANVKMIESFESPEISPRIELQKISPKVDSPRAPKIELMLTPESATSIEATDLIFSLDSDDEAAERLRAKLSQKKRKQSKKNSAPIRKSKKTIKFSSKVSDDMWLD